MKYFVAVEIYSTKEVEAESEEQAMEIVRGQLDPRACVHLSIAKEIILDDEPTVDAASGECGTDSGYA